MKHSMLVYAVVSLSLASGCTSGSLAAPAKDASPTGRACAAPGAYLATTDTSVRSGGARGADTVVVDVDPLILQGRGVASTPAVGVPTRTVARTEFSRGGVPSCD
jgi:hypothetical protein